MERLARLTNIEVAAVLYEVADLLEIKGVRFKPMPTGGRRRRS